MQNTPPFPSEKQHCTKALNKAGGQDHKVMLTSRSALGGPQLSGVYSAPQCTVAGPTTGVTASQEEGRDYNGIYDSVSGSLVA